MNTEERVRRAMQELAAGRAVVLIDHHSHGNDGELVFAAQRATSKLVSFMVRHGSGYVRVAMPPANCDRLDLNLMWPDTSHTSGPAFTVTVDAARGVSTGISATDRARTIRMLADPDSHADDFTRPGHVLPMRAADGGVLSRPDHTEGAVDLCRLAGLAPVGVQSGIVGLEDPTRMATLAELEQFSDQYGLQMITLADLVAYRKQRETLVRRISEARIPTQYGTFRAVGYEATLDETEHVAWVLGRVDGIESVPARVHSECLAGDVFGSTGCRCRQDLDAAMAAIAAAGHGVVVYLRRRKQDPIATITASECRPGSSADSDDHLVGAQILGDLGVRTVRHLSDDGVDDLRPAMAGVS
jgi:3,4-dihydroxy 2-butanone 4-phosphate synthase/GTP cyclohydrolase II